MFNYNAVFQMTYNDMFEGEHNDVYIYLTEVPFRLRLQLLQFIKKITEQVNLPRQGRKNKHF